MDCASSFSVKDSEYLIRIHYFGGFFNPFASKPQGKILQSL